MGAVDVLGGSIGALDVVGVREIARFLVIGVVFGQVSVHPDLDLACLSDENHLLHDVEVPDFLVQNFKPVESGFVHVQQVLERNVVDLLESHLYLVRV